MQHKAEAGLLVGPVDADITHPGGGRSSSGGGHMTPCIGDGRDSVGGHEKGDINKVYTCKTRMKKLFGNELVSSPGI